MNNKTCCHQKVSNNIKIKILDYLLHGDGIVPEDSDEGEDPSETASMLPAMCSNQKTNSRYAFLLPAVGG